MKAKSIIPKVVLNVAMFVFFVLATVTVYKLDKTGMSSTTMFNIAIGIVSLLGLAVLGTAQSLDTTPDDKGSWLFYSMVVIAYLGIVFDNISWVIDGSLQYRHLNYVMCTGSFLIMPILIVLFWNYQNFVFIGKTEESGVFLRLINVLAVVDVIAILIGCATGKIFSITPDGHYISHQGEMAALLFPAFVVISCIVENLKHKQPLRQKVSLLAFGITPVITMLMLIPLENYAFVFVVFFLNLILVYGTVQSQKAVELAHKSRELTEKQTQIMISQIQPHFLYNTLTAIHQLCDIDTQLAQKTIQDFSTYLRSNMDGIKSTEPIPFEKELAHTKTYLSIEMLRFSDILNIEYDVQVTDFDIPALSLQPLVENAVKYGIRSREDGGTVTITTKREGGKVFITVHDDGTGFDTTAKKEDGRSHTGIENTRKRLQLMVGGDLEIVSEIGVGTTATITLEDKHEAVTSR